MDNYGYLESPTRHNPVRTCPSASTGEERKILKDTGANTPTTKVTTPNNSLSSAPPRDYSCHLTQNTTPAEETGIRGTGKKDDTESTSRPLPSTEGADSMQDTTHREPASLCQQHSKKDTVQLRWALWKFLKVDPCEKPDSHNHPDIQNLEQISKFFEGVSSTDTERLEEAYGAESEICKLVCESWLIHVNKWLKQPKSETFSLLPRESSLVGLEKADYVKHLTLVFLYVPKLDKYLIREDISTLIRAFLEHPTVDCSFVR
ncbi:hypothetical protein T440DRAFT_473636 [Plenodomus tracheiphilus IPT5]|uniref:Uncharacterized protein n=1 Tax=Plenodomus tracheiphilus IPT5 TaxID=1408161 RepID=A0A6A7APQ6_9PLEO|nr:hypothetical protein T440DRAFT_473636 [Plenodomus tracheiphilus IPT5]